MPTNDERREVAARLREDEYALGHFGLVRILGFDRDAEPYFDGYHRYTDRLIKDMRNRLADLIEPDERICTFTENWDDPDLPLPTCSACGWEAEETDCVGVIGGPMYLYDGKFCKECGAKVVEQ